MKYILFIFPLSLLLSSCTNHHRSVSDQILSEFDSVNQSLKKSNELISSSADRLYDSLIHKVAAESRGKLRQFYYTVHDFYGYLGELKKQFLLSCGDSTGADLPVEKEDNLDATNRFFLDTNTIAKVLFPQVSNVISQLYSVAETDSLKQKVKDFEFGIIGRFSNREKFIEGYFKNAPPVAVLVMLKSFEIRIRNMEQAVYSDYYKK